MRKLVKWVGVVLAGAFVLAQLYRPSRQNPPARPENAIEARMELPPTVATVLSRSCKDCHSRHTRWPWYSNVAPVSWIVAHDVEEGREHLDLSDWASYGSQEGALRLGEMCKEVRAGAMPLGRYVRVHSQAALSTAEREALCSWAHDESRRLLTGETEPPTASGSARGSS